jgi:small-conductance mechanosensitive channel
MLPAILNRWFYHNRVSDYLLCLAILAGGILVVTIIKSFLSRRLKVKAEATPSHLDDFLVERIGRTGAPLAYLAVAETSLRMLEIPPHVDRIIDIVGIVLMAVLVTLFTVALVRSALQEYVRKQGDDPSRDRVLKGVSSLVNAVVWIIGALFVLDNLGFKISTVVAGLGIGGIAVALAAQAVLGDFFAYFTILFDRPFETGDFIIVGDYMGTVEHLGIKTTRLAGLGGEQIIVSNKDLTDSRVRNYKRMTRRRVAFKFGVKYETAAETLREIPRMVEGIVREIEGITFDRAHFLSYGDFNLIYEIVYYVGGNDFNTYMDVQQTINLRIFEEFRKSGIGFAYPTQTLYLARQEKGT